MKVTYPLRSNTRWSRRKEVERWLVGAAVTALITRGAAALLAVRVWGSWPAARFLLAYVAPMVVAVSWWIRARLRTLGEANVLPKLPFALDVADFQTLDLA